MKALRSPAVTGVLVVIALGVLVYQVVWPQWKRSHPTRATPAKTAANRAPTPASKAPPAKATPGKIIPANNRGSLPRPDSSGFAPAKIERSLVESRLAAWLDGPQRDPFLLAGAPSKSLGPEPEETPSPVPTWTVKGIWRQSGSRLAAINNGIYQEGDSIEGYKIERIESDQVWFRGPKRLENLALGYTGPKTNIASKGKAVPAGKKAAPAPKASSAERKGGVMEKVLMLEPRKKK